MRIRLVLPFIAVAAAAACDGPSTVPSEEENRDLDQASEMLDRAPETLNEIDDSGLAANSAGEAGEGR